MPERQITAGPERRPAAWRAATLCALLLGLPAGALLEAAPPPLKLGAASSYLECAARDLLGERVEFVRLVEPGMCPGHFDLRPSHFTELLQCQALLRFDFQKAIDAKLARITARGIRIVDVTGAGGMCHPSSYTRACRQLAEAFVTANLMAREDAEARCAQIASRVGTGAAQLQREIEGAGLKALPVVASSHQKDFCEGLGLRVVASFRAPDMARISEVDDAVQAGRSAGAKLVVANLPEGRRLADALAERLGVSVVEFGNFPDPRQGEAAFDHLISANVRALLAAAR